MIVFTGLVEDMGEVVRIGEQGNSFQITITSRLDLGRGDIGASIAVNGVCLTAVAIEGKSFTVEASPETLERTTLRELKRGDPVNLEQALRLSDRLGGHLVSGHIDGTGKVESVAKKQNAIIVTISTTPEVGRYLVAKGSVGLDGISLTVNEIQGDTFSVSIIPHTAQITTIGRKKVGDRVNIETDLIGKYVERFLHPPAPGSDAKEKSPIITPEFLAKHGFS